MSSKYQLDSFLSKSSNFPLKFSVIGLMTSLILFLFIAYFYQIDQTILAYGEVISLNGEKQIYSKVDGNVSEIKLQVGTKVKSGDVLIQIQMPFETLEHTQKTLEILKAFYDEQTKDNSQVRGWPDLKTDNPFIAKLLSNSSQSWQKYLVFAKDSKDLIANQIGLLDRKITSSKKKRKVLGSSKNQALLSPLIDELDVEMSQLHQDKASVNNDIKTKIFLAKNDALNELKNSYLQIHEYYESHIIRAPASGIIARVDISSFVQIQKSQKLLSLIPEPAEYGVRLKIPSRRIGKLPEIAILKTEIDSYPYQKFGYFSGKIKAINQTVSDQEAFFEVTGNLELPGTHTTRNPAFEFKILPGMKVKTYIVVKKYSILEAFYERTISNEKN